MKRSADGSSLFAFFAILETFLKSIFVICLHFLCFQFFFFFQFFQFFLIFHFVKIF